MRFSSIAGGLAMAGEAAKALIDFLSSAQAAPVIAKAGLQPIGKRARRSPARIALLAVGRSQLIQLLIWVARGGHAAERSDA